MAKWRYLKSKMLVLGIVLTAMIVPTSTCIGQSDSQTPPFVTEFVALTRQLDELVETTTTYRVKVDGDRLSQQFNERMEAEMEKSFVVAVKDLDVAGEGKVRIEFAEVEGLPRIDHVPQETESFSIVVAMSEDDAYSIAPGSRVRVKGNPKIYFRPSRVVMSSREFQESVIAAWQLDDHACYLLFPKGRGELLID